MPEQISVRDLYARVCLWLVQAWVRISFAAIFADIPRGWFKLMTFSSSVFKQTYKVNIFYVSTVVVICYCFSVYYVIILTNWIYLFFTITVHQNNNDAVVDCALWFLNALIEVFRYSFKIIVFCLGTFTIIASGFL